MRYTDVFCRSFSLETGTKAISWFYIIIYLFNCFINIFIMDIVKSYQKTTDMDMEYDKENLQAFHYVCLVFGIVTMGLAAIMLLKFMNQSETFLGVIVKWNVFRCLFAFVCIIYVCVTHSHILTVFLSSFVLIVDLCVSTYFTGIIASYLKVLENPEAVGQKQPAKLISHVKIPEQDQTPSKDVSITISSPNEKEVGILNAAVEHEDKKEKNSAPCVKNSQEVKTVEVVIETKHEVKSPEVSEGKQDVSSTPVKVNQPLETCSMEMSIQSSDTLSSKAVPGSDGVTGNPGVGVANLGYGSTDQTEGEKLVKNGKENVKEIGEDDQSEGNKGSEEGLVEKSGEEKGYKEKPEEKISEEGKLSEERGSGQGNKGSMEGKGELERIDQDELRSNKVE